MDPRTVIGLIEYLVEWTYLRLKYACTDSLFHLDMSCHFRRYSKTKKTKTTTMMIMMMMMTMIIIIMIIIIMIIVMANTNGRHNSGRVGGEEQLE